MAVVEAGTFAGMVTPVLTLADPNFFGSDSLTYTVTVPITTAVPAGGDVFVILGHSGIPTPPAIANTNTLKIEDPEDNTGSGYYREGDCSASGSYTEGRAGSVNYHRRNTGGFASGNIVITLRTSAFSAGGTAVPLAFLAQVLGVSGYTFPAQPAVSPQLVSGFAANQVGGSSFYTVTTQVTAAASAQAFVLHHACMEFTTGDTLSNETSSGSPGSATTPPTASLNTSAGTTYPAGSDAHKDLLMVVRYKEVPSGSATHQLQFRHNTAQAGNVYFGFCSSWWAVSPPASEGRLSIAYSPTRRRMRARVVSGALDIERYDDGFPPSIAATVSVETTDCRDCHLSIRADGRAELAYIKSDVAYLRVSQDGGRTWGVPDTIASGYQAVLQAHHPTTRGKKLVMLWKESSNEWYASVGVLNSGGTAYTYSSPALKVSSAKAGADLVWRPDGVVEFDYPDTSDVNHTVRCRSVSGTTVGSFS